MFVSALVIALVRPFESPFAGHSERFFASKIASPFDSLSESPFESHAERRFAIPF